MANVIGLSRKNSKVAILRSPAPAVNNTPLDYVAQDLNPTLLRFNEFWTMMEAIRKHGYLNAAMSTVGRSAVGAWWSLRRHSEFGENSPERHRKRLFSFYMQANKEWDNIKDFQTFANKLMIAAKYLRYFGQAAFQIVKDKDGNPAGLDFLHGLVIPNIDAYGKFQKPAFVQYPTMNVSYRVEFNDPRDIVYITNPDWQGYPFGGSDIESLAEYTLPIDLYLQVAAREYMKNRDKPEVVYSLPADISDEAFDAFVKEMEARRGGAGNLGRNPIAIQGEFDIKELRPLPDALPYQDSRKDAREEVLAVAGVTGAQLGISESLSSANLREARRQFHETSMLPLFKQIELALYEQIHVRTFNITGWEFKFNNPDFLNAVERATVHMRYQQMGALNPNEIRYEIGQTPRTDEAGDKYADEKPKPTAPIAPQGSPPEGRPQEPDAPAQTGEPTLDNQDPPRGDQHDQKPKLLAEARLWKKFVLNRIEQKKNIRSFNSDVFPPEMVGFVHSSIGEEPTRERAVEVFSILFEEIERN